MTALRMGVSKKTKTPAATSGNEEVDTALSPSPAPVKTSGSKSTIADDHPQVKFYIMKGNKTPEQIEAWKLKVQAREERQHRG